MHSMQENTGRGTINSDLQRLAEKICGDDGILWDKTLKEGVKAVESLLCEAMDEIKAVQAQESAKLWMEINKKEAQKAYTRAANVARKHEFGCGCYDAEAIAAAIERLGEEKP